VKSLKLGRTAQARENVAHLQAVLYTEVINVELGKLACSGLEGHFGSDLTVGARKALLHYAYKLKMGRRPVAAPHFLEPEPTPHVRVELTLDRLTEEALEQEAQRQHVTMSRLATHAVLVYLAELDFLGVVPGGTTPSLDDEPGS
jgi:hypothetical protein